MAKQQTANQTAAPATPPAETASTATPPVDTTSQTQDTPPAQQETREQQTSGAPQPASEPTVRERLKDLSENSPYLEQQQIAVEALSKWDTAQMWHETAEMWSNKAFNYVA